MNNTVSLFLLHATATAFLFAQSDVPTPSQMPLPLSPGAKVVPLWPAGSPTLKGFDEKEVFTLADGQPDRIQRVVNVHNPSIELHLAAPEKAHRVAIVLAPGGGNTQLVVGTEGTDVAAWLNEIGISAFILRYRLRPYDSAVDALADTQRSVRLIRSNAKEWGIDADKIGIMGFSAGGEQAGRAALNFDVGDPAAADPVERQSDRPDFVALVYPGWGRFDLSRVPKNAPPAFLTSAGLDDASHARATVDFYNALFQAKIPVELHIYGHGGHGNGIKPRNGIPFGTWQNRFVDWLVDLGAMTRPVFANQ
jgi:endo-1,4-beta-xylanase